MKTRKKKSSYFLFLPFDEMFGIGNIFWYKIDNILHVKVLCHNVCYLMKTVRTSEHIASSACKRRCVEKVIEFNSFWFLVFGRIEDIEQVNELRVAFRGYSQRYPQKYWFEPWSIYLWGTTTVSNLSNSNVS